MTGMLASVTSTAEARVALDAGVDLIDLKDPAAGALGALPETVVRAVVKQLGGHGLLSATAGDLEPQPDIWIEAATRLAATRIDYLKLGLFPGPQPLRCLAALAPLCARGVRIVIVLFADREPDFGLLPAVRAAGCAGVMLDTAGKRGGRLTAHLDIARLRRFVAQARALGLLSGLAGSLRPSDIPELLPLAPDYLGFRGALCGGDRTDRLALAAVARVRALIPQPQALPA